MKSSLYFRPEAIPSETAALGEFKYDMAWQKRGSGRCYDSKSGVGTIIGNKTGKVVACDIRSKDCRTCSYYNGRNMETPEHQCSKNWNGSSKAMEPDVGGCLVSDLESKGASVDVIRMDDDATTMAKIRRVVDHPVTKWSESNNSRKNLGTSLFNLREKHKCLTPKVVEFFQTCYSCSVAQNKGKPEKLAVSLKQIVPHAFGEHESCDTWCR